MLTIHPTLQVVNGFVDQLGTVPALRPELEDAMQRLREDFPGDTSVAAGVMMISEKLDVLLSAYESFLAFNKLGGHNATVRQCAYVVETLFTPGRRPARLTIGGSAGGGPPQDLLIRPPTAPGGPARVDQAGFYTKNMDEVFRLAAFVPSKAPCLRTSPSVRNVLNVTRDEAHTFLVGLCTAPGVSFELEAGKATLVRRLGCDAVLTRRRSHM